MSGVLATFRFGALRHLLLILLVLAGAALTAQGAGAVTCPGGRTMVIVAHQDDDVIFMGSDVIADIKADRCVRTVFVTAGDAGEINNGYWSSREVGAAHAHAKMLGIGAGTTNSSITSGLHKFAFKSLTANPRVSLIFMRLRDGGQYGGGSENGESQSLYKLWVGEIPTLSPVADADRDGLANTASYDRWDLFYTLRKLMEAFKPDKIRIQNYVRQHKSLATEPLADHSDHLITAAIAYQAAGSYAGLRGIKLSTLITGYLGYEVFRYPQNVFGADLNAKNAAMRAYGHNDRRTCANRDCSSFDELNLGSDWWGYPRWMSRQYTVTQPKNLDVAGAFEIRGYASKCIDVRGAAQTNGSPVQLYACVGQNQQKWIYNKDAQTLTDKNSRKCLTQSSATPSNGAGLSISTCVAGRVTQKWKFTRDGEIVGAGGKCLQVREEAKLDGSRLILWDCNYSTRQLWGYGGAATARAPAHRFETSVGGMCITAEPAAFASIGAVTVRPCSASTSQLWRLAPSKLLRGPDGKCLSIQDLDGTTNGKDIVLRPCDLLAQTPLPVDIWHVGSGTAILPVGDDTGKCLTLRGGVNSTGTIVESQDCAGANQDWKSTPPFPGP